jgi:hypothetical protein
VDAKERTRNEILAAHAEQERIMQHFHSVGAAQRALLPPSTMRTRRAAEVAAATCLVEYNSDGQQHSSQGRGGRKRAVGAGGGGGGSAASKGGDPMATLAMALGDDAVRADLVAIVRDMESRAQRVFETSVKVRVLPIQLWLAHIDSYMRTSVQSLCS